MILAAAVLLAVGAIAFTLFVSERDLPQPEETTGYEHLTERKARIYENLRDLQFEYRVGKLSDEDYQRTKTTLQGELALVLAEIDKAQVPVPAKAAKVGQSSRPVISNSSAATGQEAGPTPGTVCPSCGATFPTRLKFCGECGKTIA